jgi:putative phosphoesterase
LKVAIISDIHGNLYALERVLEEIERESPEQIVCLGDVVAFGPQPIGVLHRVRALGCPIVMGNCDDFFVQWPLPEEDGLNYAQVKWAAERLSPEDRDFMGSFQPTVTVQMESGASLLCFHGSPRSNTEVILTTTPDEELADMLGEPMDTVMIGGHTHLQMVRRMPGTLVANAGSVGMPSDPRDRSVFVPWAEWALIESSDAGLSVDLRRTPLDVEEMTRTAVESEMPGIQEWIAARRQ